MRRELEDGEVIRLGESSLSFADSWWLARRPATRPSRLVESFAELLVARQGDALPLGAAFGSKTEASTLR
jgi:hypothetical protein